MTRWFEEVLHEGLSFKIEAGKSSLRQRNRAPKGGDLRKFRPGLGYDPRRHRPDHPSRRVHLSRDAGPRADPGPRRGAQGADRRRRRWRHARRGAQAHGDRAGHHGRDRRRRDRSRQAAPAPDLRRRLRRSAQRAGDLRWGRLRRPRAGPLRRHHRRFDRSRGAWRGAVPGKTSTGTAGAAWRRAASW